MSQSKLFKQRLLRVHVSTGIVFSLLMYMAVFFGIFAILLPYIQVWEKPSRHFQAANITQIDYSAMIDPVISDPDFPQNNIIIKLPGYMNDPALHVTHQFVEPTLFNPRTQEKLNHEGDQSQLAAFLNGMHYGEPLKDIGYTIFGFMAVGVMFLIIGGLILIKTLKFQDKGKNQQASFSKWHRKIFLWVFPPFIIITLTGALMCIGYTGAGAMTYIATKGEQTDVIRVIGPVLSPNEPLVKRANIQAPMLPISQLIAKAQNINPAITFQQLRLINWKDTTARVELKGYNPYKPFLNGIFNRPKIILNAVDGSVIKDIRVLDKSWPILVTDALYFLHLLFGVDIFTRLFIASLMLASCGAIGFGVMLYLEKKAKKFEGKIPFYHWMGKLSLAVMIGVIPSTALLFNLQWLLPFDLSNRVFIQQAIFFNFWLATLAWSYYRMNSYVAAKEFCILGGILFMAASLTHFVMSGFSPLFLLQNGMANILSVDIGLILTGVTLLIIGYKLPVHRQDAKTFWNKSQTRTTHA
jgi:hypothetical protein